MFEYNHIWVKVPLARWHCNDALRHLRKIGLVRFIPAFNKGDFVLSYYDKNHFIEFVTKDKAMLFKLSWEAPAY